MALDTRSAGLSERFSGELLGPRRPGLRAGGDNVAGRAVTEGGVMVDVSSMRTRSAHRSRS